MNAPAPPFATIMQMLLAGRAIPFLGSGASLSTDHDDSAPLELASLRPPSAGQLTRYLAGIGGIAPEDATDLPRTAQHYDTLLGLGSLREQLHHVFKQPFPPARLHRFLARIPALPLIVTTNYDDLLERAFHDADRPYHLVIHNSEDKRVRIWRHGAADLDRTFWERRRLSIFPMAIEAFLDGLEGRAGVATLGGGAGDAGH